MHACTGYPGESPAHIACIKLLIERGSDLNLVDDIEHMHHTALGHACISDNVGCARLLLEAGAEAVGGGEENSIIGAQTVLELCTAHKAVKCLALLKEMGQLTPDVELGHVHLEPELLDPRQDARDAAPPAVKEEVANKALARVPHVDATAPRGGRAPCALTA
jgi:ankyrin repeat protein